MLQDSISVMVQLKPSQTLGNISSICKVSINGDHHIEKKNRSYLDIQLHTKKRYLQGGKFKLSNFT